MSAWLAHSLGSKGHTWATIALCFIVWGKDGLQKTMRNNSTNHSGGIIDSTWGHVPGLQAHSEAEAILEQRLLFVPLCWGKDGLRMFTRKQRPYLSNDCFLFHCVRQGWPSHAHSEAEAILEQRLLFVPLCWGKDRLCMLTRKQRPYLSNDCSLFHCVEARTDFACSLETEAILEQRLLFVSLCEARMAFTRLWGIIVQIIPGASLTAPEDECLACTLTRKRRPYLSNDCSLFHCVRQGWPSQDYE